MHVAEPNFSHVQDFGGHHVFSPEDIKLLASSSPNSHLARFGFLLRAQGVKESKSWSSATGVIRKMTFVRSVLFSLSQTIKRPVFSPNRTIQKNYFTDSNSAGKETDGKAETQNDAETPKKAEEPKHRDAEKEPLPEWPGGVNPHTGEKGGPKGPEPTRFGDWERKGRVTDF